MAAHGDEISGWDSVKPFSISSFRGLDVKTNPLLLEPNQATECTNWDLAISPGALNLRMGYDILDSLNQGTDTIYTGIAGHFNNDGDKQLFATLTKPAGGLSYVYDMIGYTANGSYDMGSFSNEWLYRYSTPSWTLYDERLILANGYNRPILFDGSSVRSLVDNPPGSFDFAPLKDTTSTWGLTLDGDYYYATRIAVPCTTGASARYPTWDNSFNLSGLSWKVHIDDDWVVIKDPKIFLPDSCALCDGPDSVIAQICRTREGRSWLDSFFLITEIRLANDDTGKYWIDSIPDDSLGVMSGHAFVGYIDTLSRDAIIDHDSLVKAGAMVFLGYDTTGNPATPFRGISKYITANESLQTWTHTHYFVMYYDSALAMVTDSGPSIRIPVQRIDTSGTPDSLDYIDYSYSLGLPPVNDCTHLWRLICRGQQITTTIDMPDTAYDDYLIPYDEWNEIKQTWEGSWYDNRTVTNEDIQNGYWYDGNRGYYNAGQHTRIINGVKYRQVRGFVAFDTTETYTSIGPFVILDTIKSAATLHYVDSLDFRTAEEKKPPVDYDIGWTLSQCDDPTVFNDRLYMFYDNWVYFSERGELGKWPPGNKIVVGDVSSDKITALHVSGGALNIFKNNQWCKLPEFGDGAPSVYEYNSGLGCIAPHSILNLPDGGMVWLASDGIYSFSSYMTSEYKASSGRLGKVSQPIQPYLDRWNYSDLRECHAWLTENKDNVVFSFPTLDTSLVYALNGAGWGIWTYAPRQTTHYDITSRTTKQPIEDIVFILDDKNFTYIYGGTDGTVKTDPSFSSKPGTWTRARPQSKYKTAPLFINPPYRGDINGFGVWKVSDDTTRIVVEIYDESNSLLTQISDSVQHRWKYKETGANNALYYQLRLWRLYPLDSLAVQQIDIWYRPTEEALKE